MSGSKRKGQGTRGKQAFFRSSFSMQAAPQRSTSSTAQSSHSGGDYIPLQVLSRNATQLELLYSGEKGEIIRIKRKRDESMQGLVLEQAPLKKV
jgi:hypothetical protein